MKDIVKMENVPQNVKVREYMILRVIATLLVLIGHSMYLQIVTGLGGIDYQFPIESNHIVWAIFNLTQYIDYQKGIA